jgi:hypothetical protein
MGAVGTYELVPAAASPAGYQEMTKCPPLTPGAVVLQGGLPRLPRRRLGAHQQPRVFLPGGTDEPHEGDLY